MKKYHVSIVLLSILLIVFLCVSFFYGFAQVNDISEKSTVYAGSNPVATQFDINFPELMFCIKVNEAFSRVYPACYSAVLLFGGQHYAAQYYYPMLQYFIFLLAYVLSLLIIVIWNQSKDGKKRTSSLLNNKLNRRIKLV